MLTALEGPAVFAQLRERFAAEADVVDRAAQDDAARPPADILASWCESRSRVLEALVAMPEGERIPWIGPPMGAPMMASARIMGAFAHVQDVCDALGVPPVDSHQLRHVAHLGVATRDYAFRQRRLDPPAEPFRVELTREDETWTWGPAEAAQRIYGAALDFALLATRRRHRQDGRLVAEVPGADAWLDIVQAFAGRPGPGRTPLSQSARRSGAHSSEGTFFGRHPDGAAIWDAWYPFLACPWISSRSISFDCGRLRNAVAGGTGLSA